MKKQASWFIIAAVMVIVGLGIIAFSLSAGSESFEKHSFIPNLTAEHTVTEDFSHIDVDIDTANISFCLSEDGSCRVVTYNDEDTPHTVSVKDDTLWIKSEDNRKWYEHISINFSTPELEIYLPKAQYESLYLRGSTGSVYSPQDIGFDYVDISISTGDIGMFSSYCGEVTLSTSTGSINVSNISADKLSLTASTGKINVKNINCKGDVNISVSTGDTELEQVVCGSFISTGSTGHLTMTSLIARNSISIERSTGDVNFYGCDAAEIKIVTDTGEVEGELLSEKIFFAESDTGDIEVPKTTRGGICEIITDTGDIKVNIAE